MVKELFCDLGGWSSPKNYNLTIYRYLQKGLQAVFGHCSSELSSEAIDQNFGEESFLLPLLEAVQPSTSATIKVVRTAITEGQENQLTDGQIDEFILYCSIIEMSRSGVDLEFSLLQLLMSFNKMGNVLDPSSQRRISSFKNASDRDVGYLMDNMKSSDYLHLYKITKYHLDKLHTTPEIITGNILKMLPSVKNVSLLPLINYAAYSGMTAITNVTKALSSFPAFPWNALVKKNPLVQAELKAYHAILQECSKDLYLGYKLVM